MSASGESICSHSETRPPSSQERISREFEDRVAQMLRRLGFEVSQRALVPIAPGVYHEVDQLCFSEEMENGLTRGKVVWVETKLKLNGGLVGKDVLLQLWGAFACLLHHACEDDFFPAALWVVTNGRFSHSAWNLAKILNEKFGQELFVLIDGNKLKRLMPEEFSAADYLAERPSTIVY